MGVITAAYTVKSTMMSSDRFKIEFTVNGSAYTFAQDTHARDFRKHVGERVIVHYDPNKPKRAWAETPGKGPYSEFMHHPSN
ncbi:MAG: hypothetical protein IJ181_11340 [Acidaminococcaceae bacterium]|nr:hypothetical protein [Acidaminococcaceae bacterium]